jgi:hypothetical protein
VTAEADEPLLGAKGQASYVGVDPVGPDHQVKAARRRVLEGDLDARPGLGQRGDGVAEAVVAVACGPLVQQGGQVATEDLQVATGELPRDGRKPLVVLIDDDQIGLTGLQAPHDVQDAHPLQHLPVGLAFEVDGLPAGAQRGRLLHHRDGAAVAVEPIRQGGAGDTRPGDQDLQVAHRDLREVTVSYGRVGVLLEADLAV